MSDKHTPGPWTIHPSIRIKVLGAGDTETTRTVVAHASTVANAEFIVAVVNNYDRVSGQRDELLKALREARLAVGECRYVTISAKSGGAKTSHERHVGGRRGCLACRMDAAITKAERG